MLPLDRHQIPNGLKSLSYPECMSIHRAKIVGAIEHVQVGHKFFLPSLRMRLQ